jgi:hypothetical protein
VFVAWREMHDSSYYPVLKDALSNRWPARSGYQKHLLRFMAEALVFMYHPKFEGGYSLTRTDGDEISSARIISELPKFVMKSSDILSPVHGSSTLAPRLDYKLEDLSNDFASLDGCILVMPVCHRWELLPTSLRHYAGAAFPAQIIVAEQPSRAERLTVPEYIAYCLEANVHERS